MDSSTDWKSALSASDRYAIIQSIRSTLPDESLKNAMALEQAAYEDSHSREEYDAACNSARCVDSSEQGTLDPFSISRVKHDTSSTVIGSYRNCVSIADGITSEVYRSGENALKVIVAHNIEPHNPQREIKILKLLKAPCIPLLEAFRDQEQRQILVFPFLPLTLAALLERGPLSSSQVQVIFGSILQALCDVHSQGIIHRDIKPSAILLQSPTGPAFLSDFGTAWHPELSKHSEPGSNKVLDIGTGPYRAPETLFVDKAYGTAVDMWGLGVVLAESITSPPQPPFESRSAHEDGNQLGLILSIFKTLGTPTPETWPEASNFKVSPFELWTQFPQRSWQDILPEVDSNVRSLVASLVIYSGRLTADEALQHGCLRAS